ncbi:MAG: hypothetical protein ACMUEL_08670 [Flavobacteriales bacterium Tduv]
MFRVFEVENKKNRSILRSTAQISFSQLCMERSTRRSEFFKKLKNSNLLGRDGEKIKKIYQKDRE